MTTYNNLAHTLTIVDGRTYIDALLQTRPTLSDITLNMNSIDALRLSVTKESVKMRDINGVDQLMTIDHLVELANAIDPKHVVITDILNDKYAEPIELSDLTTPEYANLLADVSAYLKTAKLVDGGIEVTDCNIPYIDASINVLLEMNQSQLRKRLTPDAAMLILNRTSNGDAFYCRVNRHDEIEYGSMNSVITMKQGEELVLHELATFDLSWDFFSDVERHATAIAVAMINLFAAVYHLRAKPDLFL